MTDDDHEPAHGRRGGVVLALCVLAALVVARAAAACPHVPEHDPIFEELLKLNALGRLPPYDGTLPICEAQVAELLQQAGEPAGKYDWVREQPGFWARPLQRAWLRTDAFEDPFRPYNTPVRPRKITVGGIAVACEHEEGRPCGEGVGGMLELDSSVGYQDWLSLSSRFRFTAGSDNYEPDAAIDRLYLSALLGPVALTIGRDSLLFGPQVRTPIMWGDHPAPLDHVGIGTAQPVTLVPSWPLRLGFNYVLGVLRGEQIYPHPLVSTWRLQLELFDRFTIGVQHLIQLGGDGAPSFDFGQFLADHISKVATDSPVGFDNHRIGGDMTMTFPGFFGARIHFAMVLEDTLTRFDTETDYNLGLQLNALGPHSAWIELLKTGYRSHEHDIYTTGLTQDSRIVGNPLGPEIYAAAVGGRIHTDAGELYPSLEYVDLNADIYTLFPNPIDIVIKTEDRPSECRLRARLRWSREWARGVRLDLEGLYEYILQFAYVPGDNRHAYGGRAVLSIDFADLLPSHR